MGKKLSDAAGLFAPTAYLKEKDAMLKGVLAGSRIIKTKFGDKTVYSFKVVDATCRFVLDKADVEPEAGATVDVMPSSRLERQLAQAQVGQTLTIKYLGLGKKVGGMNAPHLFDVEVD